MTRPARPDDVTRARTRQAQQPPWMVLHLAHPHVRSQRVLEKAGMTYQKDVTYAGDPVRYYQLQRSDWEAARGC